MAVVQVVVMLVSVVVVVVFAVVVVVVALASVLVLVVLPFGGVLRNDIKHVPGYIPGYEQHNQPWYPGIPCHTLVYPMSTINKRRLGTLLWHVHAE